MTIVLDCIFTKMTLTLNSKTQKFCVLIFLSLFVALKNKQKNSVNAKILSNFMKSLQEDKDTVSQLCNTLKTVLFSGKTAIMFTLNVLRVGIFIITIQANSISISPKLAQFATLLNQHLLDTHSPAAG